MTENNIGSAAQETTGTSHAAACRVESSARQIHDQTATILGTEAYYKARAAHAPDRAHAEGLSGYWLHPEKGRFPLTHQDHHSEFFEAHPELFGADLLAAYASGWVSIRRWSGSDLKWAVVYGRWRRALPVLRAWASEIVRERPEEGDVRVYFTSVLDRCVPVETILQDLAAGRVSEAVEDYSQVLGNKIVEADNRREDIMEVPDEYAVWVSPDDRAYWVPESHVAWACDHPELTGRSESEYRAIYAKFGEPWRADDTAAREEIVSDLLRQGWGRLRRYSTYWSYTANRTPEVQTRIRAFLRLVTLQPVFGFRETDLDVEVKRTGEVRGVLLYQFLAADDDAITLTVVDDAAVERRNTGDHYMREPDFPGFWISPHGLAFPVATSHIEAVCVHPDRFGVDEIELRTLFAAYKEPWASEGDARTEIVRLLVGAGWVRARRYRDGWTFNVPALDAQHKRLVGELLYELYGDGPCFEEVRLDHAGGVTQTDVAALVQLARASQDSARSVCLRRVTGPEAIPDAEIVRVTLKD